MSEELQQSKRRIREWLKSTRFTDAPIVAVLACVGGEKQAAVLLMPAAALVTPAVPQVDATMIKESETYNMERLIVELKDKLPPPTR
jgi:hypothetical protein